MNVSVLTQLAALKGASAPVLKAKWRELFETEPPAYNRRFLESRLAYRIQELAYGGLSRETLERLSAMAKQYATRDAAERKARPLQRPIAGTRLIREYQGVEHCVTVRADDFEYLGRPYKSLSSIAREITGMATTVSFSVKLEYWTRRCSRTVNKIGVDGNSSCRWRCKKPAEGAPTLMIKSGGAPAYNALM